MAEVKYPGNVLNQLRVGAAAVRKTLHRISVFDLKALFAESFECWSKHNAPRMGAALAYYSLMSLMPVLLILMSVAGMVFGAKAAESGVIEQLQYLMGTQRATIIDALWKGAQNRTEGVLASVIGLLILTFGASGVLVELRDDLNLIWEVPCRRMSTVEELMGIVKERLWSLALVFGIVASLTASLIFSTVISAIGSLASDLPAHELLLHLLNILISFLTTGIVFAAVYKFVPQVLLKDLLNNNLYKTY